MSAAPVKGDSHARFPTTSWTVIRELQRLPLASRGELFDQWLRQYWKSLYAYFRSQHKDAAEAADLVQGFFYSFLEGDKILQADQPHKRFRDWLLVCARNYLISQERKKKAAKRRPAGGVVSFEVLKSVDGDPYEPSDDNDPHEAFTDAWRRDLLQRAMAAVWQECQSRGREVDYQLFAEYYASADVAQPTWKELAEKHGLGSQKEASHKADWVKRQLARAIRQQVRRYTDNDEAADEEIQELLKA